jgi:multiple antibiotic resistance protein
MFPESMGSAPTFFITSLVSLFVILDPPAIVFPYLALSSGYPPAAARALAARTCVYAFLILALFMFVGRWLLEYLGVSLPAFQIAGGLILFRIAFDMLEGRGQFTRLDTSSSLVAADYRDIALVPLAMPLLSGPGAITTVLVLASRAQSRWQDGLVLLAAALILGLTYVFFLVAEGLQKLLRESGMRLVTRLMGLILAALAVEFVLQGLKSVFPGWYQ